MILFFFFWRGGVLGTGWEGTIYYQPPDGDQEYAMKVFIASMELE